MRLSKTMMGVLGFVLVGGLVLVMGPVTGRQSLAFYGDDDSDSDSVGDTPDCVPFLAIGETFSVPCDLGDACGLSCPAFVGTATVYIGDEKFQDVQVKTIVLGEPTVSDDGVIRNISSHTFCFGDLGSITTGDRPRLIPMGGHYKLRGAVRIRWGTGAFESASGLLKLQPGSNIWLPNPLECDDGNAIWEIAGDICFPDGDGDGDSDSDSDGDGDSDSSGDGDSDSSSDFDSDSDSDSDGDGDSDSSGDGDSDSSSDL